jgi:hypothetical protein
MFGHVWAKAWQSIYSGMLQGKLAGGENSQPSKYRGCSHAKDEMRKRKWQRAPKTTMGRVSLPFTLRRVCSSRRLYETMQSNYSGLSHAIAVVCPTTIEQPRIPAFVYRNRKQVPLRKQLNGNDPSKVKVTLRLTVNPTRFLSLFHSSIQNLRLADYSACRLLYLTMKMVAIYIYIYIYIYISGDSTLYNHLCDDLESPPSARCWKYCVLCGAKTQTSGTSQTVSMYV